MDGGVGDEMIKPFVFLDLDGVLFDFRAGVKRVHQRKLDYNESNYGVWNFERIWGMSQGEFWGPINDCPNFWRDLPLTEEARDIVSLVSDYFIDEQIAILTAPSMAPNCVPGKRAAVKKHFPMLARKIIFANTKRFVSGPGKVLIDDSDTNCQEWTEEEGTSIIVPRVWNSNYARRSDVLKAIEEGLRWFRNAECR